jgi:hypothetical protein
MLLSVEPPKDPKVGAKRPYIAVISRRTILGKKFLTAFAIQSLSWNP